MITYRFAAYGYLGISFQQLKLAYKHQGFEIALKLRKAWCTVDDFKFSAGTFKLRTQHIGVGNVILMTLVFTNWCDGKLTALFRIQQSTKNKIAVKAGHAHPLNF